MLKTKNRQTRIGTVLVTIFVFVIASAFFFLNTEPERQVVSSTDEILTVIADLPKDLKVEVKTNEQTPETEWTSAVEKIYTITPDNTTLPTFATIQIKTKKRSEEENFKIAYYDNNKSAWIPIETNRDETRELFESRVTHFSKWTLLKEHKVNIFESDKEKLIESALLAAPEKANSYIIDIAYSTAPGDFVMLEENTKSDTCQTRSTKRMKEITTMIDRAVTLSIDNKDTAGEIRAIVRWQIGDGCKNTF